MFDTLISAYNRQAEDTLGFYPAEAAINGLRYPRHEEATAVATFVRSIRCAAEAYQKDPLWSPLIPNWNRVESALPTFLDEFREAVRLDNDLVEAPAVPVRRLNATLHSKSAGRAPKAPIILPPAWPEKGPSFPSI